MIAVKNNGMSILTTSTITYAMKAQYLLREAGIPAGVVKLDASQTPRGCAYGIELPRRRAGEARELLQRRGVPFGEGT